MEICMLIITSCLSIYNKTIIIIGYSLGERICKKCRIPELDRLVNGIKELAKSEFFQIGKAFLFNDFETMQLNNAKTECGLHV